MKWWEIFLIAFGGILAAGAVYVAAIFIYGAIQDHRMSKKYPDWKERGGHKP